MNEQQWFDSTDPQAMLEALGTRLSQRKLQLFACACLRQAWDWTDHLGFRRAVLVGERFADGHVSLQEMRAAFRLAWPWGWEPVRSAAVALLAGRTDWRLYGARSLAAEVVALAKRCGADPNSRKPSPNPDEVKSTQARIFRDLVGNPFRAVSLSPNWLTPDVLSLATAIHEEGMFDNLPVLADALEEAGCTNAEILEHCRGGEEHRRGCWAVDLALGRK